MRNVFWILTSALLLAASAIPARANLILDPGFESCTGSTGPTPPNWTASGNAFCGANSHTGNFDTDFAGPSNSLSQTITTIVGDSYDFSFWVFSEAQGPDFLAASFGGNQVLDLVNPGNFDYMLEDFTVKATGISTAITFGAISSGGGIWSIDDVSVTDQNAGAAPEPASLVLLAGGLLAIAWRSRRRARYDSRISST